MLTNCNDRHRIYHGLEPCLKEKKENTVRYCVEAYQLHTDFALYMESDV